jgi:hypothetical protein
MAMAIERFSYEEPDMADASIASRLRRSCRYREGRSA